MLQRKPALLSLSCLLPIALAAQGFSAYLPSSSAAKAAKLLAAVERQSALIEERRALLRGEQLESEARAVEAYALIEAGKSGPWATSDGSLGSAEAKSAFAAARAKAKAAAAALSSESDIAEALAARQGSSASLSKLILASSLGPKSSSGLERYLASRQKDARQLPEAAQVLGLLRRSGAAGCKEAAAAESFRGAEAEAQALLDAKGRILALTPAADLPLGRLEPELAAYRAWLGAFAPAAYPGDRGQSPELSRAIAALSAIKGERASALMETMALGDGREEAAAAAARLLAQAWDLSSATGRRELAALCGVPEAVMASFGSALAPPRRAAPAARRIEALSLLSAMSGLASRMAEDESAAARSGEGESALLLLERPELEAVAKSEARYATLYAEASRRIEAIYAQAASSACSSLESSASLAKAAEAALGSKRGSLVVSSTDLALAPGRPGRWLAFSATAAAEASDGKGATVSFPIRAELAAEAYAAAFAKAAGLAPSTAGPPASLLKRYGQTVVAAYDPEREGGGIMVSVSPKGEGPALLDALGLELALLGGWQP